MPKNRSKTVKVKIPEGVNTIGEIENWLFEMAQKGFFIKRLSPSKAWFTAGGPRQLRYKIGLSGDTPSGRSAFYQLLGEGWRHETSFLDYNVYSAPLEIKAPYALAEDTVLTEILGRQMKKQKLWMLGSFALLLFVLSVWTIYGLVKSSFFLNLTGLSFFPYSSLIAVLGVFINAYTKHRSYTKLNNSLLAGQPFGSFIPWKKKSYFDRLRTAVWLIVVIVSTVCFVSVIGIKSRGIDPVALPIVRLEDIEKPFVRVTGSEDENTPIAVYNLFTPLKVHNYDSGDFRNGSETRDSSYEAESYQLLFPSMSDDLVADLTNRHKNSDLKGTYIKTENPNFDLLIEHREENFFEIFAAKDKAVIRVIYYGSAPDSAVINAAAEKINRLADFNYFDESLQWLKHIIKQV